MANFAPRLPSVTIRAALGPLQLEAVQFQQFETLLKATISDSARKEMLSICDRYLTWKQFERAAGLKSEAMEIWKVARNRILDFIAIGEGTYPPFTDAGRLVEGAIFDGFEGGVIQLTERDIEPPGLEPHQSKGNLPVKGLYLNISHDFMRRLSEAMRYALDNAEKEIASTGDGDRPGDAFVSWLESMKAWAMNNGLPHGAAPKGGVSPFASFLFALNAAFPGDLRDSVNSEEAINLRLSRAVYGSNTPNG